MSQTPSNSLPDLRDIHYPDAPSWWPPGPGWWIVLAVLVALVAGLWFWQRYRKRQRGRKQALQTLQGIYADYQDGGDGALFCRQLSILLRRFALSRYSREEVASLNGEAWLSFLDRPFSDRPFSSGVGRELLSAPYQKDCQVDAEALVALCRRWIKSVNRYEERSRA